MEHTIVFEGGVMRFVYHDELAPLLALGKSKVTRASHVEPHPHGAGWIADMHPVGGPVLGFASEAFRPHKGCDCQQCEDVLTDAVRPFATRAEALEAERTWLATHEGL